MAKEATDKTAVHMASIGSLMKTLSGGNQQRAMLSPLAPSRAESRHIRRAHEGS